MREYMRAYINNINLRIKNKEKFTKEDREEHLLKIKLFQQERIIHLVITLTYVLFTIIILYLTQYIFMLFLIFFILLIFDGFYVYHYFFLENSVQYMYKQYDKMKNISNRKED